MLKLALITPTVATAAPARPNRALVIKPNRRPTLAIYREAGMVVAIWAKNNSASGIVASDLWPAKARPTMAEEASNVDVPVMSAAWLNDRSIMLRFIYLIRPEE